MSNVYGAGAPAAGLNAPSNMPPWLMDLWNYVNPTAAQTAGSVDDQGRPTTPIAGAQQGLAASALNDSLTARPATPAMMAAMVARGPGGNTLTAQPPPQPIPPRGPGGGSGGGAGATGWDTGINAALHPA